MSTAPYLEGLKDCIVVNLTSRPFITSDNPAVSVNRFHIQKSQLKIGGSGILSSGYMLVLPLSPKITFISYDSGVYSASLAGQGLAYIRKERDVEALNALQVIRASENLYFQDKRNTGYIGDLAEKYKSRRPDVWHRWTFAVERPSDSIDEFRRFEVIKTSAEMRAGRGFMHLRSEAVNPGVWCSLFSFRSKPILFDTQSASGPVRSQELWNARDFDRAYPRIKIPRRSE